MNLVKQHLAAVMAGLVVLGGSAFVATQQLSAPGGDDTVTLAQDSAGDQAPSGEGAPRQHRPGGPGGPGGFPKAIRGEVVVPAREGDGYATVRFDRGVLQNLEGSTLVLEEDDGTSVEILTDGETRVYRDGEDAELSDLQAGDHVATFRVKDGDAFVTKGVRAISPERWDEMQERRDQMQERREGMRDRMRERRENRDA